MEEKFRQCIKRMIESFDRIKNYVKWRKIIANKCHKINRRTDEKGETSDFQISSVVDTV